MLQGDCNAPGTIIQAILDVFENVIYQYLVSYIDNIFSYSTTYQEHARDLKKVLQQLEESKFFFKESNSVFYIRKLEILVHILTSDGLYVDPKKSKTRLEFPTPAGTKNMSRFLEVVNYVQCFLPGLTSDTSILLELQGE